MSDEEVQLSGAVNASDVTDLSHQSVPKVHSIQAEDSVEAEMPTLSESGLFNLLLHVFAEINEVLKKHDPCSDFLMPGANAMRMASVPSYSASTGSTISLAGVTAQTNVMSYASDSRRISQLGSVPVSPNINFNGFAGGPVSWNTVNPTAPTPAVHTFNLNQLNAMHAGQLHNPWFVPMAPQIAPTFAPSTSFGAVPSLVGQNSLMNGIRYVPGSLSTLYDPTSAQAHSPILQTSTTMPMSDFHKVKLDSGLSRTQSLYAQQSRPIGTNSYRYADFSTSKNIFSAEPVSKKPTLANFPGVTGGLYSPFAKAVDPIGAVPPLNREDMFAHIKFPEFKVDPAQDFTRWFHYADPGPETGQTIELAREYCARSGAGYGGDISLSAESPDVRRARAEARAQHMTDVMRSLIKTFIVLQAHGVRICQAYMGNILSLPLGLASQVLRNELAREVLVNKARWEHLRARTQDASAAGSAAGSGGSGHAGDSGSAGNNAGGEGSGSSKGGGKSFSFNADLEQSLKEALNKWDIDSVVKILEQCGWKVDRAVFKKIPQHIRRGSVELTKSARKGGTGGIKSYTRNGEDSIRIMQANPDSKYASQHMDYVKIVSNGRVMGKDGKVISQKEHAEPARHQDAHIPLNEWMKWQKWNEK